ncbi:MAG: chorismate synthase [Eubacteriales bacterium]
MSSMWGRNIRISIFGESHGKAIGATIDGLPSGVFLDMDKIDALMQERAPGRTPWSTPRKEIDRVDIISGLNDGYTAGTPLTGLIHSYNKKSTDYEKTKNIVRPSHADYTGNIRYKGYNIIPGGGHFSGRLTAPLVFAGAVAMQILEKKGISINARIYSIGQIKDDEIDYCKSFLDEHISDKSFPTVSNDAKEKMIDYILKCRAEKDSVGGVLEVVVNNMPAGIGSPIFDNLESNIASILFAIPAVKGVEFGEGFDIAKQNGSQANDEFEIFDGKVVTKTNKNGGILGGISSGMPLVVRCAIKPTPSISLKQNTIDIEKMEKVELEIKGRHDPCIVPRAIPVAKAAVALAILDTYLSQLEI